MARLVVVAFLCVLYVPEAAASTITPHDKLQDLDKFAKSLGWGKETKKPIHIPAQVKAAVAQSHTQQGIVTSVPMLEFGGCGKKVAASKLGLKISAFPPSLLATSITVAQAPVRQALPGAGAGQVVADNGRDNVGSVNGQEPFLRVLRDGYFEVGCYHDSMAETGDKYGDNKDKYGSVAKYANVSIANYNDLVLEMEHKEMTPRICFEFCRTLPSMGFFGIRNGNECYCEPYFSPRAVDDSRCDVGCQGNPTIMCGNAKGKSTIWEMHLCADTAEDLAVQSNAAEEALTYYYEISGLAYMMGTHITGAGQALETLAGLSGSPNMAELGKEAKVTAGDLTKAFISGRKQYERLYAAAMSARDLKGADFTVASKATEAEHAIATFKETQGDVLSHAESIRELVKRAYPAVDFEVFSDEPAEGDGVAQALHEGDDTQNYRDVSYAMGARDMEPQASTCSGKAIGVPMVGLGLTGCRLACEQTLYPEKCVAIAHHQVQTYDDLCFMFSDVTDVETFEEPAGGSAFLEKKVAVPASKASGPRCDDGVLVALDVADCPGELNIANCANVGPGELCEGDGECGTDVNLNQCGAYDMYRKEAEGVKARAVCEVKMSEISSGYKPKGEFKKNARCFGTCEALSTPDEVHHYDIPTNLLMRGDAKGSDREPMLEKLP